MAFGKQPSTSKPSIPQATSQGKAFFGGVRWEGNYLVENQEVASVQ